MADRNLTEGNITRNLWVLAWPQMTEGALYVFYQMVDLFWAGQGFGLDALAGVGAVWTYANLALTARGGLDTAMRAMVSRAVGAGDMALANRVVIQAFVLSTALSGMLVVLPGMLFGDQLLQLLGIPADVRAEVGLYMRFQFLNQGLVGWRTMSGAALLAGGDSITPLRATAVTRAIHLVASPVLAFGLWIFPEMGLLGLAIAGIIGQLVGALMNWNSLFSGRSKLQISFSGYRIDWGLYKRLLRLGIPASVTSMERALSQLVMVGMASSFGVTALAVFTLAQRTDLFANRVISGLASASGVLVGQNLGAGRPERARQTVFVALNWTLVSQTVFSLLLAVFPVLYISVFNDDPSLHPLGTTWFRIMAIGYIAMGVTTVLTQTLNTAGDTMIPAIVNMATIWLVQVPLAIILDRVLDVGPTSIAWAIVLALIIRVLLYTPYFLSNRWMRARVL